MKYPVSWDRDRVIRVVIVGGIISPRHIHGINDLTEMESLQATEVADTYGIFKDKQGNVTFQVRTEGDIVEKIDPEVFVGIENVQEIIFSGVLFTPNSIKPLPDTILELPKLKTLILRSFDSTVFPKIICRLENLENLQIRGSEFAKIPKEIGRLRKLTSLEISGTPIKLLPAEVGDLHNLTCLKITWTQIKELPPQIRQLTNLTDFSFRNTDLTALQPEICQLRSLKRLDVSGSKITHLPKEIQKLKNLEELNLQGNPLQIHIPPEILSATKDPSAILEYYFCRKTKPLNEIKLIMVGEASVGKTSLVQRLVYDRFDPAEPPTTGVSIHHWQVDSQLKSKDGRHKVKVNIWDFGGGKAMQAAHQAFLTQGGVYLLVLDSRLTLEENNVDYWLELINSCRGDSPLVLVVNKIDHALADIDWKGLLSKIPKIAGIFEISARTGEGMEELKAVLMEQGSQLPHARDLQPQTWSTIKANLEEQLSAANSIPYKKYLELCIENKLMDEISQRTLISTLRDMGLLLYFHAEPRLEELGILDPYWVLTGIYKILNSRAVIQNKGVLTGKMLNKILNFPEYPPSQRTFILELMGRLELCSEIRIGNTFRVPALLPEEEPDGLDFDGVPGFLYEYAQVPHGVFPRFIVRMEHLIHQNKAWRTGVLLKIDANTALVRVNVDDRRITISINGPEKTRRDALSAIRTQFDEIHQSLNCLRPQKQIPVPGGSFDNTVVYDLPFWFIFGDMDRNWLGHW